MRKVVGVQIDRDGERDGGGKGRHFITPPRYLSLILDPETFDISTNQRVGICLRVLVPIQIANTSLVIWKIAAARALNGDFSIASGTFWICESFSRGY